MFPAAKSKLAIKTRKKGPQKEPLDVDPVSLTTLSSAGIPPAVISDWPAMLQELLILLNQELGSLPLTPEKNGWNVDSSINITWTDNTYKYRKEKDLAEGALSETADYSGYLYLDRDTTLPTELDQWGSYYWLENVVSCLESRRNWMRETALMVDAKERLLKKLKLQPHQLLLLTQR